MNNNSTIDAITLPAIHDAQSIQQALSCVLQAVAAGTLDNTRARILLSALKLAMTNLRNMAAERTRQAQQAEASAPPKASVTLPAITATQTPEDAPRHVIHSSSDTPSTAFAPITDSYSGPVACLRTRMHAAAVSR